MNNFKNILALLLILAGFSAYSQQKNTEIKGKVINAYTKAPVEGAVISAAGLEVSVSTDKNGLFGFDAGTLRGEIRVWAPGFYTQTAPILGRSYVEIAIIPENQFGHTEWMQIPNMGTLGINEKISNLYSVDRNNIDLGKVSVEQILRTVPGIQVIDKSGMPGEGSYFSIRGNNTFLGNTMPLIVINGMPMMFDLNESPVITGYSRGILTGINPRDVKNITVLRGSETAQYGSMGSNGVILIETEKAVDMDTKVEFTGSYGVDMNQSRMPVLSVDGYKKLVGNVALTKYPDMGDVLKQFPYLKDDPTYFKNYLYNNDTDWQDLIYSPGFVTDNMLTVKGGDAIAKYDMSVGYSGHQGQVKNTDFQRYYGRFNTDVSLSRRFGFFVNLSTVYSQSDLLEQGMVNETNPLLAAMRKAPLLSPYEKDQYEHLRPDFAIIRDGDNNIIENNSVSNPLAVVSSIKGKNKNYDIQLNSGLTFDLSQSIKLSGIFGLYYNMSRESLFIPGRTQYTIMPLENGYAINTSRAGAGETLNTYYAFNATYNKTLNYVHNLRAGITAQLNFNTSEYDAGKGINTASDFYKTLKNTNEIGRRLFGYNEAWNWLNYTANIRYIYNSILGVNLAASYDGASSVGSDANRYELYPAAGVALYGKNLPLLRSARWIDNLTFRADYTTTGNSRFSTYLSKYYYETENFRQISGLVRANIPNPELRPEINRTASVGFDLALLGNRLQITSDVYRSKVSDVIMSQEISSALGSKPIFKNMAEIENKGIEAMVNIALVQGRNMRWNVGGTIGKNINKVLSLGGAKSVITEMADGSALITEVGSPMYSFYGYKANGVFSTSANATASGLRTPGGVPFGAGDVIFEDFDKNGIINTKDRENLGSAVPDFFGTVFMNLRYKRFELNAVAAYSYNNMAYNAVRRELESMRDFGNQAQSVSTRWTMEGQQTAMPRAVYGDPMDNNRFSNRFVEKASYVKLKEVMVSYRLEYLNGITVYASGENLYTLTDYLGLDPEFMYSYSSMLQGFDYAKIPLGRVFRVGLKLQF